MKVCLIGLHFAEYTLSLASSLSSHCSILVILSEPNAYAELGVARVAQIVAEKKIKLILIPHYRSVPLFIRNSAKIVREVYRFAPNLVHFQEEPKDYQALAMPLLKKFPMVLTVHDPAPHAGLDARRINMSRRKIYLRSGRDLADVIIVHGRSLIEKFPRIAHRTKTKVIPHGPLGLFDPNEKSQRRHGELLFFGRIEAYKGLSHFIESIKLVRSWGIDVRGVVAGRGSELEKYREQLRTDKAFDLYERFLTPDEVAERFDKAHIVLLPYTEGTQSGVAAYAAGRGRPVIASNVGSLSEMVIDGETGIIVSPGDTQELAHAIARLVQDDDLTDRMGHRSFCLGQERAEEVCRSTLGVYESLLAK